MAWAVSVAYTPAAMGFNETLAMQIAPLCDNLAAIQQNNLEQSLAGLFLL